MPGLVHVAFNALFLDPGVSGGTETYLRRLVPAIAEVKPHARLTVVTTRSGAAALRADGWAAFAQVLSLPCEDTERVRHVLSEQVLLGRLLRHLGADLLHSLANLAPALPPVHSAVTFHDAIFLRYRTLPRSTTLGLRAIMSLAARRAGVLISPSAASADDLTAAFGLRRSLFEVVPHGADLPSDVRPLPEAQLRERLEIGDARVVLCVAAKRPHKNQELLLRALPLLPDATSVVLVGQPEPYDRELRSLAVATGVVDRVRFVSRASEAELEGLWRLAACAAFPTLAEGFGLPVLEAMARGVPVACSELPVLREVGGDAAHYFCPRDPHSAADAIQVAWSDPNGATAGRRRAAGFTWAASARGHWAAYERALARGLH